MYWLYCRVYKQCVWTKTQIILRALHQMSSYTICRLKRRCLSSLYIRVQCRGVFCADWQNFGFGAIFCPVLVVTTSEYWLEDQVLFRLISLFSPHLLTCTPWVINLDVLHCFIYNSRKSTSTIERTDLWQGETALTQISASRIIFESILIGLVSLLPSMFCIFVVISRNVYFCPQ